MVNHTVQHHFSTPWPAKHVDPLFVQESAFRFIRELRGDPRHTELKHLPPLQIAVTPPGPNQPHFQITFRFDGPLTPEQIRLIGQALAERYQRFAPAIPANSSDH
jgi:hypothetical protein